MGPSTDTAAATLPLELRWLRAHLRGLTPWHFIDNDQERSNLRTEFQKEVERGSQPERDFLPFARRQDQDDVAGFVLERGSVMGTIIVVHLTWTHRPENPGFPRITRFSSIWDWMKNVIDDTALWCSEEDLLDVARGSAG